MIGGLDFLFDFDNFPIDDELINNFRTEAPGSRRAVRSRSTSSPHYDPIFQYRTNAYGMVPQNRATAVAGRGLPDEESGGPGGNGVISTPVPGRTGCIGKANLDWQVDRYNRLKLGGEFTQYDIDYWSTELDQPGLPDAYKEKPIRWNVFVEDRLDLGDVVVVGGLRYDCYDSRASRPDGLPRRSRPMPGLRSGQPDGRCSSGTRATTI